MEENPPSSPRNPLRNELIPEVQSQLAQGRSHSEKEIFVAPDG
jgi:hypothetical protein